MGSRTVSRPTVTSGPTQVVAGSSMVTPLGHEARVDAVARDGGELRELGAAVHAEQLVGILGGDGGHAQVVAAQDLHHVREVVLVLDVGRGELADVGGEKGGVKGIEAGVAGGERRGLLGRAVLLLDDARDRARLVKLQASVAERVLGRPGEDGRGGLARRDGGDQAPQGLGFHERARRR